MTQTNNCKIVGPTMIPGKKMLRYQDEIGFYELEFSAEQIEFYWNKFQKSKKDKYLKINHDETIREGVRQSGSFILSDKNRQFLPFEQQDLPDGTWMMEYTYDSFELLNQHQKNGLAGFSLEGKFTVIGEDGREYSVYEKLRRINKLSDILSFDVWVFGGSTEGRGRNEHGDAHFEIKEKNTRISLGKIYMPNMDEWKKSNFQAKVNLLKMQNEHLLSAKDIKGFVRWLDLNDNENLLLCHTEWNECNKDNNRTVRI